MIDEVPQTVQDGLEWFSGRTWLPEKVLDWYQNTGTRLLLLTGEMGSGKSVAAAWLAGLGGPLPAGKAGEQLTALRSQVVGAHFCQAGGGSVAPKALAVYFNRKLSDKIASFDEAFTRTLAELLRIDARLRIEQNQPGASATVVKIDNLNLGLAGDEKSFNALLHDPLRELYFSGFDEPLLLVVDGLDEAGLYTEPFTILSLMRKLEDLPQKVRFLATIRSNSHYINDFPGAARIDLEKDSPDAENEVREFVNLRLAGLPDAVRSALVDQVLDAAESMFLHASLVCQDVLRRQEEGESLLGLQYPKGLSELYRKEFRYRIGKNEDEWERNGEVLGLIGVGQGAGLNRTILEEVVGADVLPALKASRSYLDGALTEGPFRHFHKSLSEYLFEDEGNVDFRLDTWRLHKKIVDTYWEQPNGKPAWKNWDAYQLEHMPVHLRYALQSPIKKEAQRQVQRLVSLLAQEAYHQRYLKEVKDFSRLEQQVRAALQIAVSQQGEGAALLVVQTALNLHRFQHSQTIPVAVFDLAEAGHLDAAMRMLAGFDLEPKWAKAAAMTAAWLADAAGARTASQALMQEAKHIPVNIYPLDLLERRVEESWTGVMPAWEPLPGYPPERGAVLDIIRQLGGGEVEPGRISEYLNSTTGLVSEQTFSIFEGLSADAASGYLAFTDGPMLVTYAREHEAEGSTLFASYVQIHGANQYRYYRDLSLWMIIEPVLRHPQAKWVRWGMRQVLEQALKPVDLSHEQEDIDLAALGRLAAVKAVGAQKEFDDRRGWALRAAAELSDERHKSDQYGRHKQRLCALAEAASHLKPMAALRVKSDDCEQAGDDGISELIRRSLCMAGGFAGFLYKAWLRLADTVRICRREAVFSLEDVFERARQAAINIHDPVFAALAAAEVNACRELWLANPLSEELDALVRRFVQEPLAAEFAPRLRVGDDYKGRNIKGAKMPVPYSVASPHDLSILAAELGLLEDGLERLNQPQVPDRQAPLAGIAYVRLPADNFAPLLAERLSAAVLADAGMQPEQRQALLQLLAPVAARQGASLDIVLGRLLLAAEVSDVDALLELRQELSEKNTGEIV